MWDEELDKMPLLFFAKLPMVICDVIAMRYSRNLDPFLDREL